MLRRKLESSPGEFVFESVLKSVQLTFPLQPLHDG